MSIATALARPAFAAAESGRVPDSVLRAGIRSLVRARLRALATEPPLDEATLRTGPIAPAPREANEQHYEVQAAFFELVLGPWLKYSGCLWPDDNGDRAFTLADAEAAMLELTCARAGLADGQDILDLGCGWGALTLFAAERWPGSRIVAVSHSSSQRRHIEARARRRGLRNIQVITQDVSGLDFEPERFDRVVSVEMFEHMNNHELLVKKITRWMRPGARLFVHVFCHHARAYRFTREGPGDWMAREFFTGGLMPSASLVPRFRGELESEDDWFVPGTHYARTAEAWLANLDAAREGVAHVFADTYGPRSANRWVQRWRLFFMAVAETFAYSDGHEWGVSHHRLRKQSR
ncbi:MAG: cyclopropane-fatty-acyl-phospholipid synthase [Gemmatimonadota bacterium]|nr:cyclopropane-fatty-acyl-phospholipid synthase [Gemmatimonadota bacterium]